MELKAIPFSKGFFATSDGKIFDANLIERTQYENGSGYKTASICLENERWVTFGVHRLVALAHIPNENPNDFTVNHRDLNKKNNNVSNLEWLTVQQNNYHLALFRKSPKHPVAYTVDNLGKYNYVINIEELCGKLKVSLIEIWDAVKNGTVLNGYFLYPFTHKTIVPKQLKINRKNIPIEKRPVKILDLENDNVMYFDSLHHAAKAFETTPGHICISISNSEKQILFKRNFIIVEKDDDFPPYEKEEISNLLGTTGGFQVLVFNLQCERYEIYESARAFIFQYKLSKKAVTTRLRKNKIEEVSGFYFAYFNKENRDRLFEVIGRPGPSF